MALGGQRDQRPNRRGGSPLTPDDLSHVTRCSRQLDDGHAATHRLGHLHRLGMIDQRLDHHLDDRTEWAARPAVLLRHYCAGASTGFDMSFVRCLASSVRTESEGCAPSLIQC